MLFSSVSLLLGVWALVFAPMLQLSVKPSLNGCIPTAYFSLLFGGLAYTALLDNSRARLAGAFKLGPYTLPKYTNHMIRAVFATSAVLGAIMSGVFVSKMNCWSEYSLPWLSDGTPLFPRVIRQCYVHRNHEWMYRATAAVGVTVILVGSVTLSTMFVTRLKQVGCDANSDQFDALAVKSSIICISSLCSTVASMLLIVFTGFVSLTPIDLLCNTALLFLLFSFGDSYYHCLFGWLEKRISQVYSKPLSKDPDNMSAVMSSES